MTMSLKERMALKKQQSGGTALTGLKGRLGGGLKKPALGGGSSLRNKFQKRDQTVLDKTYEDRNERSKGGGSGKTVFNQELMAEYGIEDFTTSNGDRFVEVLPISFDAHVPYFREIAVHFSVGFSNDAFICMNRFFNNRCYRCDKQATMWRDPAYTKDEAVALFPTDRACYLLWERTKELIEGESPNFTFQLWASPKKKVHSEIQEKVRDKLNRTTLDISDLSIGGDGRTVGFTIVKQGEFPDYKAFDLIPRKDPIPDEVIEKLDTIITAAKEQGYDNCIDMFFNIPEYNEIKEVMDAEEEMLKTTASNAKPSLKQKIGSGSSDRPSLQPQSEEPQQNIEDQLIEELAEIQKELESISQNPLRWRKWCNENGYPEALEMDAVEAVPAIIDDMYEKAMAEHSGDAY